MAYESTLSEITLTAGADLSASQYLFVEVSAADTVTVADTAGEAVVGVLTNAPASGETASVALSGVCKLTAGAAVSAGAKVATDADGKAVAATAGAVIHGIALEAAGADGDIIAVALFPNGTTA